MTLDKWEFIWISFKINFKRKHCPCLDQCFDFGDLFLGTPSLLNNCAVASVLDRWHLCTECSKVYYKLRAFFHGWTAAFETSSFVSHSPQLSVMVRDNAKMLAFNDLGLPSPVAYLDQGEHNPGHVPHLHWDAAYFYDNMREKGFDKGRAYKFYKITVDIVGKKHFAAGQVELKGLAPRCSKCIWEKFVVYIVIL